MEKVAGRKGLGEGEWSSGLSVRWNELLDVNRGEIL
jgi:hypothetical protein